MANWSPDIMLAQKRKMDASLQKMNELNEKLTIAVGHYSATMQDNVSEETKAMVKTVKATLESIRSEIDTKLALVQNSAKGMGKLESSAKAEIASKKKR
ncbi:MAG: hypothetical protein ACI4MN_03220 [Candidatus Coproplasma sp.]